MYARLWNICKLPTQTCSATVENGVYMFVTSVQIHVFFILDCAARLCGIIVIIISVIFPSVYLACTKLVLAPVHLDISLPSLPEDSLTFSPWPGLQCHWQLELKAHEASFLHYRHFVSCTASDLNWHTWERSDFELYFQDLNVIISHKWPPTHFGFSQSSCKLKLSSFYVWF